MATNCLPYLQATTADCPPSLQLAFAQSRVPKVFMAGYCVSHLAFEFGFGSDLIIGALTQTDTGCVNAS